MDDLDEYFEQMTLSLGSTEDNKSEYKQDNACSSCGKNALFTDNMNGHIVCRTCGVVNQTCLIDDSAEWNFGPEDAISGKDPSRCGCPINPLLQKSSLSTMIGKGGGNKFWLMKKIHQQNSMDYVERARWHVFEHIAMVCDNGSLSTAVTNQAKEYYKKISEKKLSRGGVRQGLIACCIMFACRKYNVTRSVKEIATICDIDASKINSSTKIFQELLGIELTETKYAATKENDLILRFCCALDIGQKQYKVAKEVKSLYTKVEDAGILVGKTPSAVTSALIFICANKLGLNIMKKDLSVAHNVSVVTLNKIINIVESFSKEDL